MKAEPIIWFLNAKLKERKIAGIAVTVIDTDGVCWDIYSINQAGKGDAGLYAMIGAVDCLRARMIEHGAPSVHEIAQVLESAGVVQWEPEKE